jgi:hypothetical protein
MEPSTSPSIDQPGSPMRVRALQLATHDEAMLRLFINLRQRGEQQAWALQAEPGADVTLTRFAGHEAVDASTFTIWVLDAADPPPDDTHPFVGGPLHYDRLADILDPIAKAWRSAGREGHHAPGLRRHAERRRHRPHHRFCSGPFRACRTDAAAIADAVGRDNPPGAAEGA